MQFCNFAICYPCSLNISAHDHINLQQPVYSVKNELCCGVMNQCMTMDCPASAHLTTKFNGAGCVDIPALEFAFVAIPLQI